MSQGKLKVVKQEMARVIDVLGISELKWTGMGEFNSDDHYIYSCGQESLRRNRIALIVNRRVLNTVLQSQIAWGFSVPLLVPQRIKAVYCHPAYLTYTPSTSCKMQGWMTMMATPFLLRDSCP